MQGQQNGGDGRSNTPGAAGNVGMDRYEAHWSHALAGHGPERVRWTDAPANGSAAVTHVHCRRGLCVCGVLGAGSLPAKSQARGTDREGLGRAAPVGRVDEHLRLGVDVPVLPSQSRSLPGLQHATKVRVVAASAVLRSLPARCHLLFAAVRLARASHRSPQASRVLPHGHDAGARCPLRVVDCEVARETRPPTW